MAPELATDINTHLRSAHLRDNGRMRHNTSCRTDRSLPDALLQASMWASKPCTCAVILAGSLTSQQHTLCWQSNKCSTRSAVQGRIACCELA